MWAITYFNEYNNWKRASGKFNYYFISNEEILNALK